MSSIDFLENYSLKNCNTFGLDIYAKKYIEVSDYQDLKKVISETSKNNEEVLILGGGSNILFTKNFDGVIIKNEIKGIEIIEENNDTAEVKVGAGEQWHGFVLWCISNGYGGVEN